MIGKVKNVAFSWTLLLIGAYVITLADQAWADKISVELGAIQVHPLRTNLTPVEANNSYLNLVLINVVNNEKNHGSSRGILRFQYFSSLNLMEKHLPLNGGMSKCLIKKEPIRME